MHLPIVPEPREDENLCLHQTLTTKTLWGDSIGLTTRVICRSCGKTIEIPHVTLLKEGGFRGIVEIAFGKQLTD